MRHWISHPLRNWFAASLLCAAAASAGDLAGPALGHIADLGSHSLRPIRGIPGAATWGDPLDAGADVSAIALAPRRAFAVLVSDAGVRVAALDGPDAPAVSDPGLPLEFRPTAVVFSPSGANAALYDAGSRTLWMLRAAAPAAIDISKLPGPAATLAIGDGPEPAIAAVLSDDPRTVFILDASGGYRALSNFGAVAGLAFVGPGRDLAIADRGAKRVFLVRDPLSGNAPEILGAPEASRPRPGALLPQRPSANSDGPFAIASSADGKFLAVAAGRSAPALYEFATGEWTEFRCDCDATALAPLNGNAVFRLGDAPGRTLWILDADSPKPRLVFVPAAQPPEVQP
jgi:hypothetical protein